MNYLVVIVSISLVTFEYQVTENYILRKTTPDFPDLNADLLPPTVLLDQRNGKLYTVVPNGDSIVETKFITYDTGWKSDQSIVDQIEIRQVSEDQWTCVDIIESNKSSDKNPFGSNHGSKKITRICKIQELENLIKNEDYYKFFAFYRTDIELPFRGIVTKEWMEFTADADNTDNEFIISRLIEVKDVSGTPADIEEILKLPIENR